MIVNLAIVENNPTHITDLLLLIEKWKLSHSNCDFQIDTFLSGKDLLETNFYNYQLIFMDIELDEISGLDVAHKLRENGFHGELVFTTSYHEYVFRGYDVFALNFLIKPISYEKLSKVLSYIEKEMEESYFYYCHSFTAVQIPYRNIIYFSSCNQYVEIYTTKGITKIRESLKHIRTHLPSNFVQCHRTAIVNIYYISKMDKHDVYLTNDVIIPISQTFLVPMQEAFMKLIENSL
ncbi:MAG: LytTR family DNA-binding domain-containing protein [Lachnospiraceae bacterium]|nr:LytTR family DNA-binding domain-containing protein [Lachnospiraceae bacterium]